MTWAVNLILGIPTLAEHVDWIYLLAPMSSGWW